MPEEAVRLPLELVDKTTGTLDKVARQLGKLDETQQKLGDTTAKQVKRSATAFKRLGSAIKKVGSVATGTFGSIASKITQLIRSTSLWAKVTAVGLAGSFGLLIRKGLKLNTEMEKYQITLNTILKSQKRANALISFIIRFAETTPFEVQGLVDLAAQIEAAGLSSKRWLPIVGDLSAAFGGTADKTFQLVRALRFLRAGVAGEAFETLRRFGIASREFEERGIKFTSGRALKSSPDKVLAALEDIVKTRFGGLMDKMSKTFTGTMSNIGDTLTNVLRDLMAPLFKRVTLVAREFLDVMEKFGNLGITGDLIRRFGSAIGDGFQKGIDRAKELLDILATGGLRPALASVWEQIKPNARKFAKWLGGILADAVGAAIAELRTNKDLQKVALGLGAFKFATNPVVQLAALSAGGKALSAGGKGVVSLGSRLLGRGAAAGGAKVLTAGGAGAARNALFASEAGGAGAAAAGGGLLGKGIGLAGRGAGLLGTGLGAVGGVVGLTGGLAVAGGAALIAAPIAAAVLAITNAQKERALEEGLKGTQLTKVLGEKSRRKAILRQLSDTGRFGDNAGLVFKQLALTDPKLFKKITSAGFDTDDAVEVVRTKLASLAQSKAKEDFGSLRLEFEGFGEGLGQFLEKAAKSFETSMKKAAQQIKKLSNAFATPTEKVRDYDSKIAGVNQRLDSTLVAIQDLAGGQADLLAKGDALKALEDQRTKLIAKGVKLRTEQVNLELKLEQAHRKTNAAIIAGFFGGKNKDPLDQRKRLLDLQQAVKAADKKGRGFSADELTKLSKQFPGLIEADVVQAAQQKEFEKMARKALGDRAGRRLAARLPGGRITRKEARERFGAVLDEAKEISRFFLTDFGGATREAAAELKKQIVEGFDTAARNLSRTLRESIAKKGSSLAGDLVTVIEEQVRLQVQFLREQQQAGKTPNPGAAQGAI